ncbi:MAG: tRNA preQ1(34) S-adenosylmethionine ribosyltransferase-isomerase QueA [candidate division WOR-3 bacterium]|nr:tRNA preQ1(34) S-adenosylmethionine ribosyltransferase-isomerase QueA [candidate division WOR-3 bacterium]
MKLSDFDYSLPKELIAQHPLEERSSARLLVLNRRTGETIHSRFDRIADFIHADDTIVLNNTRVFKARIIGSKKTGGKVEILLIRDEGAGQWEAMISHTRRLREGMAIHFDERTHATVKRLTTGSRGILEFNDDAMKIAEQHGKVPLPHYIRREAVQEDVDDYQTVFARNTGSIAAPTAGLHFTEKLLDEIRTKGTTVSEITLHIGPGTFKPIRSEQIEKHCMDAEFFEISETALAAMRGAKKVFAVGTSVCRALETYARTDEKSAWADLFIYPEFKFQLVNSLITNFHLPRSTPLLLVCAFAGRDSVFKAYREAIRQKYRFLSYGDAMLIL